MITNKQRVNNKIRVPKVRLIGEDGTQVGIVMTNDALRQAKNAGLDLVEVAPNAKPPVCKILDYGKLQYEKQKKTKKQKPITTKEIKIRPNIDTHDFNVKLKAIMKFLAAGHKVRVMVRFRGREMTHPETGHDLLKSIQEELKDVSNTDHYGKMENRQIMMMLSPFNVKPI